MSIVINASQSINRVKLLSSQHISEFSTSGWLTRSFFFFFVFALRFMPCFIFAHAGR